jgi:hypothetical protein
MPDPTPDPTNQPPPTGNPPPQHQNGAAQGGGEPNEAVLALRTEREARQAAERAAAAYKTQHEADKAKWEEERTGLNSTLAEANSKATTSEIKRLLFTEGCVDVDVAAAAGEFKTVDPAKIADAVKVFREAHPSMFPRTSQTNHSFDGGAQPGQQPVGRTMNDVIRKAAGKV